jgi:signal transduction histidine kinase
MSSAADEPIPREPQPRRGLRPSRRLRSRPPGFFARLSIRWRLALSSALLTLVILLGFALVVGALTTRQVSSNFVRRVQTSANDLAQNIAANPYLAPYLIKDGTQIACPVPNALTDLAITEDAVIRYMTDDGLTFCQTPRNAPYLGTPVTSSQQVGDYRVEYRVIPVLENLSTGQTIQTNGTAILQYARQDTEVGQTLTRVRAFLVFGVLAGAGLALLAGLATARRAMRPIAKLTERAKEIERTRDPRGRVPQPLADDEVAELARTLEGMLRALDDARSETESALERQREFVADASHELRTPLTSVLANLELLAEDLHGEHHEIAEAALRSSRRMRRLVADLLLLARADAGRQAPRTAVELGSVLAEAVAELEPLAGAHSISLELGRVWVIGARDELLRMTLNLVENAVRYTPPGTVVRAGVGVERSGAVLWVEDEGPGVPAMIAERVFDRFVRSGGEHAGSSGLGLAIVRAVARSHGGDVSMSAARGHTGARFVVRMPVAPPSADRDRAPGAGSRAIATH